MTAKTKTQRFRRLISHGFFAPELPPCFVSHDLAKFRESIWKKIEAVPAQNQNKSGAKQFISEPCWFYFPRFGRDDRKHGVLNPISYLAVSKTISDNFVELRKITRASPISSSPLVFDWGGRRALFRASVDLRDDFRVDLSTRRENFAIADIRAFFHSIYTHAIPWAIYGKAFAKKNRKLTHFGNLLDLYCRNAQDGQTIGLPVGPDTSRLIAEVLACALDQKLMELVEIGPRDASRYIDDFTIGVDTNHTGSEVIAALRNAASHFELELNNDKSAVHPTSYRFPTGWKQAILAHVPRKDFEPEHFSRFFYEIGRICQEQPDLNIEKFAFQNARSAFTRATNWKNIQSHLINSYRRNPSLVSFLAEVFILRQSSKGDVENSVVSSFLTHRLPQLVKQNRTGEIIWLLFLAIRLNVRLESKNISQLSSMENSLVALLVNYAHDKGVIVGDVDYSLWETSLNKDGLEGPMWLYAYESVRLGIAPNKDSNFIKHHKFFKFLLEKNISFIDMENGLTSINATLRDRRSENKQSNRLRMDFLEDLKIDLEEFDEEDLDDLEEWEKFAGEDMEEYAEQYD
ncbi:RNA-directed DNA polymerase [Tritonibacter mobilis]|uniref:RNA-directed DNA polymerase n=1 Tax=Tritonibacter mobilis TaxID=379347 RepID=UPI00398FD050